MPIFDLLERSRACAQFKREFHALIAQPFGSAANGSAIACTSPAPAIKAARVLTQLISEQPDLAIEHVELEARSGCSDFRGTLTVTAGGERRCFDFVWDCRWRAEEEGWQDHWGEPDQIRAAREFGWRCFSSWTERRVDALRQAPTTPLTRSA